MFLRCQNQRLIYELKIDKTLSTTVGNSNNETSSGIPKVPIVTSFVLEEAFDDLDALSFGNT